MKRGTIKAFREYLNNRADLQGSECHAGLNSTGGKYHKTTTRGYGDYLYTADHGMFMANLAEAQEGKTDQYPGWEPIK